MRFFGLDGCKKGWFYIGIDENDQYEFDIITSFQEIEQITINASLVLVDIPIGLREEDTRERLCDLEARKVLGNRKSSVFPASSRLALAFDDYAEASQINFHHTGRRLSKQSFAIAKKIQEVDTFIKSTGLQGKIREMHPEVCFWALNGFTPMEFSKKKNDGFNERRRLLNKYLSNTDKLVEDSRCKFLKKELATDDNLDALVGAVSARFNPKMLTLPDLPELDNKGLKMEIVYPALK